MILDVKDLHHSFGEINAINKLSFSIEQNSIVSILGPSGCGKTTLIRLIAGLEEIQKGQISFEGKLVANEKFNTPPEQRSISYVFQDFALFPHMNVKENISFAASSKVNKKQLIDQVIQLAKVENFLDKYPHALSGGEQQRVAIARSLVNNPDLILADEMTGNLDEDTANNIFKYFINYIEQNNKTLVYVTHNKTYSLLADEIYYFKNKKIHLTNE